MQKKTNLSVIFKMYTNKDLSLSLHKQCFNGASRDFVIRFKKHETCIEDIIAISSQTVIQLIDHYLQKGKRVKGRIVASVVYLKFNSEENITYYHPSYAMEQIYDAEKFYTDHMMKILQRMDNFNRNGSMLIIDRIDEIHLHLSTF